MDALISVFTTLGPQHWLVLGLVLLIAEMATGTTYLLWPAVAAFFTALISFFGFTHWWADVAIFAVLVMVLTYFGQPIVKRWRSEGAASGLNDRAATLVGKRGVIDNFANGAGSAKVGDTMWRVVSDEVLEAGAEVEVVSVQGVTLRVKRS
ncbi:MAG TPA: NfeD family protein [Terricaulis sp.]|nr:NfeD family protein [Terricaulis sp.]